MSRSAVVLLSLAACAAGPEPGLDGAEPSTDGTPVAAFETSSCSTADVIALSRQIADEVDCLMAGQLVPFEQGPVIVFASAAVLPYLSAGGRTDLVSAASAGSGMTMNVTSGFRTVVQQYLLYRWFQLGRCGIPLAAVPGSSNHESGRALDISNYAGWVTPLDAHGWSHNIPSDPVHFEHLASPDLRGADVLAFQRLWNRNAPDDPIAEDGAYGPQTEARVQRAPAEGFGVGAICDRARLAWAGPPLAARLDDLPCAH